jgi:hypothetical protein
MLTGDEAGAGLLGFGDGGQAEEALELAAELGRDFVAEGNRGGAGVVAVVGHETLGTVETDSLEVLERSNAQ